MSNSPAPTNYNWVGNTLTYDLDPSVDGVKIKYQKEGTIEWVEILNSPEAAPTSCSLNSSYGPKGTVCGVTKDTSGTGGGWGTEVCSPIENV